MIRPAVADDADLLVWAKATASEHFGSILRRAAIPDPKAAAEAWGLDTRARICDDADKLCWRNWRVAETGGRAAGAILIFQDMDPPVINDETPVPLRPILSLLPGTAGSLYVDSVAVQPEARGAGLARAMMLQAEAEARDRALPRLTLIALSSNDAARPLYFDLGYRDADVAELVPSDWAPEATHAYLMEKRLTLT
ncbi:GNAT family N-acetyltransferase [Oceanicola sp. 22II-s10i]|uniref:GNAT family N-acetyltransferase n=1 Tax=Oceanicola sp. 22II-s10i TaxID=1317116 RepID=UPI001C3D9C77|nr:GNAT family N-acetyltransferase [Oceanicola sp. 22II-s10i]